MFGPWPGSSGGGGGAVASVLPGNAISITGVPANPVVNYVGGPYAPATGALQSSGVLQQTWVGPAPGTATPKATPIVQGSMPFGAADTTLTTALQPRYMYSDAGAAGGTSIMVNTSGGAGASTVTLANGAFNGTSWHVVGEGFAPSTRMTSVNTTAVGGGTPNQMSFRTSRGTYVAKTQSGAGDGVGLFIFGAADTAGTNISSMILGTQVPSDATFAAGNVSMVGGWYTSGGIATSPNFVRFTLGCDTDANVYLGQSALTTTSANGFVYMPATAGAPTVAPAQVFGGVRSASRVPTQLDTTNRRSWAYIGGAWHFAVYDDYASTAGRIPVGAAGSSYTDSANLTFAGSTLSVPIVAAVGAGTLTFQTAATSLRFDNGPAQAVMFGDFLPDADATRVLGSNLTAWSILWVASISRAATSNTINFSNVSGAGALSIQTATTSSFRINHAGGAFPTLWESSTTGLAFFGHAPVAQPVLGAFAYGAVWTAAEQAATQNLYNAIRTLGLAS